MAAGWVTHSLPFAAVIYARNGLEIKVKALHKGDSWILIFIDNWFVSIRPFPERIFECFLEVAAPTDSEGTVTVYISPGNTIFSVQTVESYNLFSLSDNFSYNMS